MKSFRFFVFPMTSLALLSFFTASCSDSELLNASFTSSTVQYDRCTVINGTDRESCTEDERLQVLSVDLVEGEEDRVWLTGVPRGAGADGRLLGTRDIEGGFYFVDEIETRNADSGCRFTETLLLRLEVDPEAALTEIGVDPCVALVGRETTTRRESVECDTINEVPEQVTTIIRKRWEPYTLCGRE